MILRFPFSGRRAYNGTDTISPPRSGRGKGEGVRMKKSDRQKEFARQLRRQLTDAERLLWTRLRNRQLGRWKFRRQQPIGPYIVDFVCFDKKLVLEIDGGQHNEENARKSDQGRNAWLEDRGYRILRFWNTEVLVNMEGVWEAIRHALE